MAGLGVGLVGPFRHGQGNHLVQNCQGIHCFEVLLQIAVRSRVEGEAVNIHVGEGCRVPEANVHDSRVAAADFDISTAPIAADIGTFAAPTADLQIGGGKADAARSPNRELIVSS